MRRMFSLPVDYGCRVFAYCSVYLVRNTLPLLRLILLLVLVLVTLILPIPSSFAQDVSAPGIRVDIEAGFDGVYRTYHWFPVTIDIANEGPDVQVVLEWSFLPGSHAIFRQPLDLPQGANERVVMHVFSVSNAGVGRLQVLDETHVLVRQDISLHRNQREHLTIGVISSDETLLRSLTAFESTRFFQVKLLYFQASQLSDQSRALHTDVHYSFGCIAYECVVYGSLSIIPTYA